jgi:hypothetical protein
MEMKKKAETTAERAYIDEQGVGKMRGLGKEQPATNSSPAYGKSFNMVGHIFPLE